jgi:hypothetical protein
MSTLRWIILLASVSLPCFGQVNHVYPLSRQEIQRQLIGEHDASVLTSGIPDDNSGGGRKTTGLAAIYSLIVPGMGELYSGNFESGKYFLMAEGVLWLTYASFEISGNQLRDDSRAFATAHAGISPDGKPDQYFVDIGNFLNIDEYSEKKLRDREPEKLYRAGGYAWQWDSDYSRATYRNQRIASENMYNNRKFVVAAILINHLGSAINAVRGSILHNKALNDGMGQLDLHADVIGGLSNPQGIMLTLSRPF